jgi:hypothetical protein
MGLIKGVSIRNLESIQGGMAEFYTLQSSNETMVVKVPANTVDDLFVHKQQTDQLLSDLWNPRRAIRREDVKNSSL